MAYIRKNLDANGRVVSHTAEIFLGRDENNKPIRHYVTRKKERDCIREAKKIELDFREKNTADIGKKKVVVWFQEYLDINEGGKLTDGTITLYTGFLKNHYKPFFKQMKMEKVTDYHLKRFQSNLLKKLAPSTTNRIMSALRGAFTEGLKHHSPFKDFEIVKANEPNVSAPNTREFQEILKAVEGSRYEIPVLLAGWCGFRRGEILALRVNDLDFEKGTIRIDEGWTKNKKGTYTLKTPKSKKGIREERVPDELMSMIKKMLTKGKVVELDPEGKRFLWNSRPDTFSPRNRNYRRRRDAPRYTFHELRHFHATWMWENGIPDKYAAKRMGQTEEVLRSTYQHLGLEKQREIDEKIVQIAKTARK
mgnify:CR=1 FL=1